MWSLVHLDVSRGRHPYVVTQEIHKDEADGTPPPPPPAEAGAEVVLHA